MGDQNSAPNFGAGENQGNQRTPLPIFEAGNPGLLDAREEPQTSDTESQCNRQPRPAWLEAIRHFSPSWFSVIMGTGVTATLLNRIPYNGAWLYWLSVIVFVLNIVLFIMAVTVSTIRYMVWPKIWRIMQRDPQHSLFLGAVPIGFTTIINMFVYVCVPAWGDWAPIMAWVLWMIDSVVAATITFLVPYTIMTRGPRKELNNINAVQLMPLASTLAASVSGSLVAGVLHNARHAQWTLIASYALWGMGMLMSFMILVIYYQRLALHNLPPREVIVSVFLPVSPTSLGSLSILQLGSEASKIFPETKLLHFEIAGAILYVVGCIVSLVLWGYAIVWLAYAVGAIVHQRQFPFNLGWWSFTFPLGVLSLSTINLGRELSAEFFKVLGTVFAVMDILLWIVVSVGTIRSIIAGHLLYNSCVKTWEIKEREKNAQQCLSARK